MSRIVEPDLKLPDLRIVPVASLIPHELGDESRTEPLGAKLRESKQLRNPPVVAGVATPEGDLYVVLDGANRVAAASAAGLPHLLVQVVRYHDPGLRLSTWHHAVATVAPETLERALGSVPGLTCRRHDSTHARALLARRDALAYLLYEDDAALTLHGGRDVHERNTLLHGVVNVYAERFPFHRVMHGSLSEARSRFPDVTALIVFPRFEPDEILDIALSGERLPAGITRHVIPWRALRVNFRLEVLADPGRTLEEKNRWLAEWLDRRVAQRHVRFYEESTVLFDE